MKQEDFVLRYVAGNVDGIERAVEQGLDRSEMIRVLVEKAKEAWATVHDCLRESKENEDNGAR